MLGRAACWEFGPSWEADVLAIDWAHYNQQQRQGLEVGQDRTTTSRFGVGRVNVEEEAGVTSKERQLVGYYRSVGESVKLVHNKNLTLVPWLDQPLDETPISSVSEWVLNTMEQVSEVLGLSFDGLEQMVWELFAELEKRALMSQGLDTDRGDRDKCRVHRKLKNLRWGMTYGRGGGDGGEISMRRTRGIRPCPR